MNIDLRDFHKKVFSEFGQDGVIEKIFQLIGTTDKIFVEFGSNGLENGGGNTAYLRKSGFTGLLMDRSEHPYGEVCNKKDFPVLLELITTENINKLLVNNSVPRTFDFLSIDIDGNDYWVWRAIDFTPRVVCIESNFVIPIEKNIVQIYNPDFVWDGSCRCGASIKSLFELGLKKGYSLVAICGCDLIFIRNDDLPPDVTFEDINNIGRLFNAYDRIFELDAIVKGRKQIEEWDGWVDFDKFQLPDAGV